MSISKFLFKGTLLSLAVLGLGGCNSFPSTSDTSSSYGLGEADQPVTTMPYRTFSSAYGPITQVTFSDAGSDFDPFVSVDGKNIIFASTKISEVSDIFMKTISSKVVEQITHTPNANEKQPQLSPDARSIIYASDKEGSYNIYEISATTRGSRERQLVRNERINEMPCYSPDGRFIAYSTWVPQKGDWFVATMDRRTQQEKIYGPGVFPKFSPDGKKILFQRARVRAPQWYSIWILDLEVEGVSEVVSSNNWAAITPNWSPDGKKIIFASVNRSVAAKGPYEGDDIYTIWADGTHLVRLTDDDAPDWNPVWAKDGQVYFLSKRNGFQNVWSIHPRNLDDMDPDTISTEAGITELPHL